MFDVLVAEVDSPERAVVAALRARELGYVRLEAYTPFPIAALDNALEIRRTRIPLVVLGAGLTGAAIALLIQWWTNAVDYPLDVGGRPLFSIPTDVPIVFETTVLFAAITAFAAVLLAGRLPRLHDPIFDLPGFERTSVDRFWVVVGDAFSGADDTREDEVAELTRELERVGATVIRGRIARDRP